MVSQTKFQAGVLVLSWLIRLGISLGVIILFTISFSFSRWIILSHLLLLSLIMLGETAIMLALFSFPTVRGSKAGRMLIVLVPVAVTVFILFLYLVDLLANYFWDQNISISFLATYLSHWRSLVDTAPLETSLFMILMAGAAGLIWFVYWRQAEGLTASLNRLHSYLGRYRLLSGRKMALWTTLGLITLFSVMSFIPAKRIFRPGHSELWYGEPLSNLILLRYWYPYVTDPYRKQLMAVEEKIRAGYPAREAGTRANVVLIFVDSMRSDHLPMYGYPRNTTPFLNGLYQSGRLQKVQYAFSTGPESFSGTLSTLSSKEYLYLTRKDFRLHDLLHKQGYSVYFVMSGDHGWKGLREAYGDNIDYFIEGRTDPRFGLFDDRLIVEGLAEIPHYSGQPAFICIFLMSSHFLGRREEPFQIFQPSQDIIQWEAIRTGRYDTAKMVNRYDNGLLQADHYLSEAFRMLEEKGYMDRVLTVVLADHGEGLKEKGYFGHARQLFNENISIPILFYTPDHLRLRNGYFGVQVDVAPTILDYLGLPVPDNWQGHSLLEDRLDRFTRHEATHHRKCRALISLRGGRIHKYLRCDGEMLFDLVNDPKEQNNQLDEADPQFVSLLEELFEEGFNIDPARQLSGR
jgi:glucan phosphoethanolaminetransferase (alkaline phosphatase superfamily)